MKKKGNGYQGIGHFNVHVKSLPSVLVPIVECDPSDAFSSRTSTNEVNTVTVVSRPVGDASVMRLPSKRPRTFKIAMYESQQHCKRSALEDPAASDPFYFHREVFDDDEIIELPLKQR